VLALDSWVIKYVIPYALKGIKLMALRVVTVICPLYKTNAFFLSLRPFVL
jgi:hypothetical protein